VTTKEAGKARKLRAKIAMVAHGAEDRGPVSAGRWKDTKAPYPRLKNALFSAAAKSAKA
jgi:hypothetical protein